MSKVELADMVADTVADTNFRCLHLASSITIELVTRQSNFLLLKPSKKKRSRHVLQEAVHQKPTSKPKIEPDVEAVGRVSAQEASSDSPTPDLISYL